MDYKLRQAKININNVQQKYFIHVTKQNNCCHSYRANSG